MNRSALPGAVEDGQAGRAGGARSSGPGRGGLTLLETVLATTLLAVAGAAFFSAFWTGPRVARRLHRQTVVIGLFHELFARLQQGGFEKARSSTGSFGPEFPDVNYTVQVSPGPLPSMKKLRITMHWAEGARSRELTVQGALADRRARRPLEEVDP